LEKKNHLSVISDSAFGGTVLSSLTLMTNQLTEVPNLSGIANTPNEQYYSDYKRKVFWFDQAFDLFDHVQPNSRV
jgi:hypothetical protein